MKTLKHPNWVTDPTPVRRLYPGRWSQAQRWWQKHFAARIPTVLGNVLSLAAMLTICLWSAPLLRLWDPTAGTLDIGILSILPLVAALLLVAKLAAWHLYQPMIESINQLTPWQQTLCYGLLYCCYFWAAVVLAWILL